MKAPRTGSGKWVAGQSLENDCGRYAPSGKPHRCFQLSICSSAARDRSDCRNLYVKGVFNNRQTHLKALVSCEGGGRGGAEGR